MISGVAAPLRTFFHQWDLMKEVEGKVEGPSCCDELMLRRMLRLLEIEGRKKVWLGGLSRIWKAYHDQEVHGAQLSGFKFRL